MGHPTHRRFSLDNAALDSNNGFKQLFEVPVAMKHLPETLPDTRGRLLQAAGETFAELGYRQATVRDIVVRAGANIAAVNYHFGDKLRLYTAVLRHWLGAAVDKYPADGGLPAKAPLEQRFGAFVRAFLFRLMDEGVPAWHGKLMAREMADPTPGVLEMLVETHFRANAEILFKLVRELLGKRATEERIRLCAFSVVGQCLFYRHCEYTIRLMAPQQKFGPAEVERIAEHITKFALAGILAIRDDKTETKPGVKNARKQL
jgi:AcrR family transcriptional regulator